MKKIRKFLASLMYENGEPSLTRVMTVAAFLAFLAGSAFLMAVGQHWDHYETFATITGGGTLAAQLGNKYMLLTKVSPNYTKNTEERPI